MQSIKIHMEFIWMDYDIHLKQYWNFLCLLLIIFEKIQFIFYKIYYQIQRQQSYDIHICCNIDYYRRSNAEHSLYNQLNP